MAVQVGATATHPGKLGAPAFRAVHSFPPGLGGKPLAAGTSPWRFVPAGHLGQASNRCGLSYSSGNRVRSFITGALTIRSSRNRFAVRLNSGVRPLAQTAHDRYVLQPLYLARASLPLQMVAQQLHSRGFVGKPLAGGTVRSNGMPDRPLGRPAWATVGL